MTFLSIDKEEMQVMMSYFKQSGIKTKYLDADGAQRDVMDSASDEEGVAENGGERPGRRAAARRAN